MKKYLFAMAFIGLLAVQMRGQTIVAEGDCGPTLTWNLNSQGVLRINGAGEMNDYERYASPFYKLDGRYSKVIINNEVTSIGNYAFAECFDLKEVIFPKGLQRVGQCAFLSCTALDSIILPDGVENVEKRAFRNCSALKRIVVPGGIIHDAAFANCDSLVDVSLGNKVTSIGYEAFNDCNGLKSIVLPASIKSIGGHAFYLNNKLTDVSIGGGSIGEEAFVYCSALKEVNIGENVTSIGGKAFSGCGQIVSLNIAEGVDSIASFAFTECVRLKRVVFPNSVQYLGRSIVGDCDSLTYIRIPFVGERPYVTEGDIPNKHQTEWIGLNEGSHRLLDTVELTGSTRLENGAFMYCSARHIILPSGIKYIGDRAFYKCTNLKSVNIPEGVDSIRYQTFRYSYLPNGVELPSTVTYIGTQAFANSKIKTMHIPQGVRYIDLYAFYDSKLENLIMQGGDTIAQEAFAGTLLKTLHIPSQTKYIGFQAFYECDSLVEVIIDGGALEMQAFKLCINLKKVTLGDGVTLKGESVFRMNEKLAEVYLPNDITDIPDNSFDGCIALKEITFPATITKIGGYAFNCKGLTKMTVKAVDPPSINSYSFRKVDKSIPVYVPRESLEDYRTAKAWKEFTNFLPIDESSSVVAPTLIEGISIENGEVHIYDQNYTGEVYVYNLSGHQVLHTKERRFVLPQGIYIIRIGSETAKVIVR